jgi:hypothetical protein
MKDFDEDDFDFVMEVNLKGMYSILTEIIITVATVSRRDSH